MFDGVGSSLKSGQIIVATFLEVARCCVRLAGRLNKILHYNTGQLEAGNLVKSVLTLYHY